MSKYISKAEEIRTRIQNILDAFKVRKSNDAWPDEYVAPAEITGQYPDVLLDVQNLFFMDSPQHPLFIRSMELNEHRKFVTDRYDLSFTHNDFVILEKLLSKYIQYRECLEAAD